MSQGVARAIHLLAMIAAIIFTIGLGEAIGGWAGALLCLPVALALFWLSIAVHESGHALAAHLSGSHPYAVVVMRVEFWRLRRDWRMRLVPRRAGFHGFIMAFPGSRTDPVRSYRWGCAGGPIASALAAASGLVALWASDGEPMEAACLLFVTLNAALVPLTLLPYTTGDTETDGMQILRKRGGVIADQPMTWVLRLCGRSVEGVQAQHLPDDELDALQRSDAVAGPLLAGWFHVVAARNVGDWQRALDVAGSLRVRLDGMPEGTERDAWRQQMLPTFAEAEGCRAFASSDPAMLPHWIAEHGEMLERLFGAYSPAQLPRLKAQACALQGDARAARRWLAIARRHADRSFDLATLRSEATLRARIEALLARSAGQAVAGGQPANTSRTSASDSANA